MSDEDLLDPLIIVKKLAGRELPALVSGLQEIHRSVPPPERREARTRYRAIADRVERAAEQTSTRRRTASRRVAHEAGLAPLQQELRLLCGGTATGGRFMVVNETASPMSIDFDVIPPQSVAASVWANAHIAIDPERLVLAPGEERIIRLQLDFGDVAPRLPGSLDFVVDVRSARLLVSKLWVSVRMGTRDDC